jgi:hypothetical protein
MENILEHIYQKTIKFMTLVQDQRTDFTHEAETIIYGL